MPYRGPQRAQLGRSSSPAIAQAHAATRDRLQIRAIARIVDAVKHAEPEMCSCSALRQASRHLSRFYDAALAPAGLGVNQYSILSRLERLGPLAQSELAERLVMDRSTLGHLLGPLKQRGLIEIESDPADRRRKLLSLSNEGRDRLARAQPLWASAQSGWETSFGKAQADALRIVLMDVTNTTASIPTDPAS